MQQLIEVQDISKSFGSVPALSGLSFEVAEGEIFGFLGPSGSGKTTTIKLLTRQLRQDKGEIRVFGRPLASSGREEDDRVGVLSDNSGLYERLSVWDNISLFAALRGRTGRDALEALEDVGLAGERKKRAKALSRGMKQRLLLAQALIHRPTLLFLDEPTASLDPATSGDIHRLLTRLNDGGTTIFLTTHDMEEADRLCHRVAFLNQGAIREMDAPEALKLKYSYGKIRAHFAGGETLEEEKSPEGLSRLARAAEGKVLERLHSLEPNLEEIFLKVTGRDLS